MKFLGIALLVCPLMAQIGSTGPVASVAANISSPTATALLPAAPFSGGGAAKWMGK